MKDALTTRMLAAMARLRGATAMSSALEQRADYEETSFARRERIADLMGYAPRNAVKRPSDPLPRPVIKHRNAGGR